MSQLNPLNLGTAPPDTDYTKNLEKTLDEAFQRLREILNKGLLFADNFDAYIATITTDATPGLETAITHGLKRVPSGYLVMSRDKAAIIYDGASAWTATTLYIRSDVASVTAKVIVF